MNGQLLPAEREYLHNSVLQAKPAIVLEVGTWKGGGSTWQIKRALNNIGAGILYTCEPDESCFLEAFEIYEHDTQVVCQKITSEELIKKMLGVGFIPDFVFFDGPEDTDTALNDLISLEKRMKGGAYFMMHDWDAPSIKAMKIRPYLEASKTWRIEKVLTAPESVGLVKAVKI